VVAAEEDVLWLDVAVDHAVAVGVVERLRGLAREPDRVFNRELLLPLQPVAKGFPLDERHGEPELPACIAAVEHRQDVGVLQPGAELDLAEEPVGAEGAGELGVEHLEGDGAVVAEVLREVDGRHAAAAELAGEAVAVG